MFRGPLPVLAIVALLVAAPAMGVERPELELVLGVGLEGQPTEQWLIMVRKRVAASEYVRIEASRKQLSDDERQWAELITARLSTWEKRRDDVAEPFAPSKAPDHVVIVMGNIGGQDAFTHDASTIGFDLSVLQSIYGNAVLPGNQERIDRFFEHEYTHLMQKAWLTEHPYQADSPLRAALLDIWLEGIGNYRSLSNRWRASGGQLSKAGSEALRTLGPRFAARMSALACADSEDARLLMQDLSQGRFEAKWGALPAGLWLDLEVSLDPNALRRFVLAGPAGVWGLAARHMSSPLREVLVEAQAAGSLCSPTAGTQDQR